MRETNRQTVYIKILYAEVNKMNERIHIKI